MPRKTKSKIDFGNRIKKLRIENNLTQEELGKKLNVGKSTVANYESGYSEPEGEKISKLASIFNVSIDYLLGNNNENSTSNLHIDTYIAQQGTLLKKENSGYFIFDFSENTILNQDKEYFAFKSQDDSMLPLLGKGDIAIIEKIDTYENGNTCLISLDNKLILIRKIIEFNDYIELHTAFPYSQPIKITNEEKEARNFTILGKVIKAENQSAFK